jgi:hypothetical protein
MVTIVSGSVIVIGASPAASDDSAPKAYTYWIHGAAETCQLAKVDLDDGHVHAIGPVFDANTDGCPLDLALRPDDEGEIEKIYAVIDPCAPGVTCDAPPASPKKSSADVAEGQVSIASAGDSLLVTIDPETGVRTIVGALGFESDRGMLTFDDDGRLWYYALSGSLACANVQCLYRLNPSTGAATLVADPTFGTFISTGGTASCDDVFANGRRIGEPTERLVDVNTSTGELSPEDHDYGTSVNMTALGRDGSGQIFGFGFYPVAGPSAFADVVYKIDTESGKARQVVDSLDIDHTADLLFGLEIAPLSCDPPEAPPVSAPPVVAAEPTFTG